VKNAGRLFERPAAGRAELEYRHPLDRGIMGAPVRLDSGDTDVLDPQLFSQPGDFLVCPIEFGP